MSKKWSVTKCTMIDESGAQEPTFMISYGSEDSSGVYIDDLSEDDLSRLHALLSAYFSPQAETQ